jgi:hypothetical protein
MLNDEILKVVNEAIHNRFELRDEVLNTELQSLSMAVQRTAEGDPLARHGVKLRVICEQDLSDRAQIIWSALKRACERANVKRDEALLNDLMELTSELMRQESIRLAGTLSSYRDHINPLLTGSRRKDAQWLSHQTRMAMEKYARDIENFAHKKAG